MRFAFALFSCFVGICSLGAPLGCANGHRLQLASTSTVVWQASVRIGERIAVSFVHSQERTRWIQHYRVGPDGMIWQEASTFASYGAGMPIGPVSLTPRGFVAPLGTRLGTVRMLHSKTARLTLHYRGRAIALNRWFEHYEPFVIRVG